MPALARPDVDVLKGLTRVSGARENNLRDVNAEIQKRRLTVSMEMSELGRRSLFANTIETSMIRRTWTSPPNYCRTSPGGYHGRSRTWQFGFPAVRQWRSRTRTPSKRHA